MDLRRDYRKKMGAACRERAFHDAVLAEGSIPVALIRPRLLSEPGPAPQGVRRNRFRLSRSCYRTSTTRRAV